jgi:hypothetical protein
MKIRKSVMKKVIAPNQKNDRKPSGPKTGAGEGRAAMDGLFIKAIEISAEDRPEFEAVRDRVSQQFPPATPLRQIASEKIVCCSWRCKLALRMESRAVALLSASTQEPQVEGAKGGTLLMEQWYWADHRSLQNGQHFLRNLRAIAEAGGLRRDECDGPLKESIIKGWGMDFFNRLMAWESMSPRTIRLAEHLEAMMTNYRMKPPLGLLGECAEDWGAMSETPGVMPAPTVPPAGGLEDFRLPRVVPDPKLLWQMQVKLIDVEIEHLEFIDKIMRKQGWRGTPQTLAEFSPRYFAEASRDLQRAVDWYRKLEIEGL